MSPTHRTTLLAAFVAFAFAAGFAGSVAAAKPDCSPCVAIYDSCMARPDGNWEICAREHNLCAGPLGCRYLPE
ncbi:hypothetical protein [Lysobacter enzymogenes]|uniref:hypothetical protein n=1 Tax=Lysobacter enzymogenes TaxID=69 RepID=UPI00099BA20A|nr:hypothetical protein [Lysobacter enzymogenes]QQQ01353.1 hypothetical protein JHW41_25520 [Lysobacter enzymogenes]UZW60612.1 hypothetical protein BV903_025750 [Lysobacter enzymogenes]